MSLRGGNLCVAFDRVVIEVGTLKCHGSRELEVQVGADAHLESSPCEHKVEHVPALRAQLVDEVGVVARDADAPLNEKAKFRRSLPQAERLRAERPAAAARRKGFHRAVQLR